MRYVEADVSEIGAASIRRRECDNKVLSGICRSTGNYASLTVNAEAIG